MEKRIYFIAGDLISNIVVGIVSVAVTTLLIGGNMPMLPGMLAGMVVGMTIAMGLSMGVLAPRLGIMEVMMPCMVTGMLGGMYGGMFSFGIVDTLKWGAATGITVLTVIYLLNSALTGPQKLGDKKHG